MLTPGRTYEQRTTSFVRDNGDGTQDVVRPDGTVAARYTYGSNGTILSEPIRISGEKLGEPTTPQTDGVRFLPAIFGPAILTAPNLAVSQSAEQPSSVGTVGVRSEIKAAVGNAFGDFKAGLINEEQYAQRLEALGNRFGNDDVESVNRNINLRFR